ncbi:MAG: hypothetical protein FJX77_13325 [Armatimonadetes bacterium]|nr:hypothetical protein [Armatimonadota bacterium]
MHEEEAIQEFLGDRPRSSQLADWQAILERRLAAMARDAERQTPGEAASLQLRMASLRKQIAALAEEAAVTEFVEDSVRVTLAMGAAVEAMGPGEFSESGE